MADVYSKAEICETITVIRKKKKKPTTESIFNYMEKQHGVCDMVVVKTSLKALVNEKMIENRPRNNDEGETYYVLENDSTNKSDLNVDTDDFEKDSDNENGKCLCSCNCEREISDLKSEISL